MACWPQQEAFPVVRWDHCILLLPVPGAFSPTLCGSPSPSRSRHTRRKPEHAGCSRTQGREGTLHGDSPSQGWELANAKPPQLTRAHSFTYRWHVITTSRRELAPLIFFIKMQINLIKSGIVN